MNDVDAYLAQFSESERQALERIRKIIKQTVPDSTESISYQMPTAKYKGKTLMHYNAFKSHLSIFPTAGPTQEIKSKIAEYQTGKGTLQFTLKKQIPQEIIEELLLIRVAIIDD